MGGEGVCKHPCCWQAGERGSFTRQTAPLIRLSSSQKYWEFKCQREGTWLDQTPLSSEDRQVLGRGEFVFLVFGINKDPGFQAVVLQLDWTAKLSPWPKAAEMGRREPFFPRSTDAHPGLSSCILWEVSLRHRLLFYLLFKGKESQLGGISLGQADLFAIRRLLCDLAECQGGML